MDWPLRIIHILPRRSEGTVMYYRIEFCIKILEMLFLEKTRQSLK